LTGLEHGRSTRQPDGAFAIGPVLFAKNKREKDKRKKHAGISASKAAVQGA
jgi:hypothetical protein